MYICSMKSNSNSNAGKPNVKLKNSNNNAEEEHNFKIQTITIISMNYLFHYYGKSFVLLFNDFCGSLCYVTRAIFPKKDYRFGTAFIL